MVRLTGDDDSTTISTPREPSAPPVMDAADSTFETRMAQRAARRKRIAAEEQARTQGEGPETQRAWRNFVEARDGEYSPISDGQFNHGHPAHANTRVDAATGQTTGVYTVVPHPDAQGTRGECPVCGDFRREDWRP